MRIVTTHRKVVILQAELAENPMLSERLRRIFSKTPSLESRESAGHGQVGHACVLRSPSRGNSVDSPPREDFVSGGAYEERSWEISQLPEERPEFDRRLAGEEHRTAQVVKVRSAEDSSLLMRPQPRLLRPTPEPKGLRHVTGRHRCRPA